jgi:Mg2+ and Co2+ transporter CorA
MEVDVRFADLQGKYYYLMTKTSIQQQQIDQLNSTYIELKTLFDDLTNRFDVTVDGLQNQIDSLNNRVDNILNMISALMAIFLILAVVTGYLVMRKSRHSQSATRKNKIFECNRDAKSN